MIISVNWLKKYVDIKVDIETLTREIGAKLVEIEQVIDLGEKYKDAIVVEIKSVAEVDGSDHLHLLGIDDGGKVSVRRTADGLVRVICGAPNVRVGQKVVWLPPKSTVPATYGSAEPFVLDERQIMGVTSYGMIASAKELDLSDESDGILEIDPKIKPGRPLTEIFELDDYLLDIENKSLTNRPDCFGIIGFAREVAGVLGVPFKSPEWLIADKFFKTGEGEVKITVPEAEICPKYQVAALVNVKEATGLTDLEKTYLARTGVRPLSPLVDISNWVMLLTAQPLHTFDYDKVARICKDQGLDDVEIQIRLAKKGEQLTLLDQRTIELSTDDIVICAGKTPIALAGAMGGASTAIDKMTEKVLIESATFDLYKLRSTQMRHGIFSEAVTRFTKGQPPCLTDPALALAIDEILDLDGASQRYQVSTFVADKSRPKNVKLNLESVNRLLGAEFKINDIKKTLQATEFEVKIDAESLSVTVPFWRQDINIPADVIEEIGRLSGYDNLPINMPKRNLTAVFPSQFDVFRQEISNLLTKYGANQVLTYSFVDQKTLEAAGQSVANSYRIVNSLSPELQFYRQSLVPSLLTKIHANIKAGFDQFALYELNKVHPKKAGLTDEKVPVENYNLGLVVADKNSNQTAYYQAKKYLDLLAEALNLQFEYQPLSPSTDYRQVMFEPKRAAEVSIDGQVVAWLGEFKQSVIKNFKLPTFCAGIEINLAKLFELSSQVSRFNYRPLSRYPKVERDICFEVASDVNFHDLIKPIADFCQSLDPAEQQIDFKPVDIYQIDVDSPKRITLRLTIYDYQKTLSANEANQLVDRLVAFVSEQIKLTIV